MVWLILVFTVAALWVWSVGLWAAGQASFGDGALDVPYGVVMPIGYFVVALLLMMRKPTDQMAILTSLMLVFLGPYLLTGVNVTISQQPGWELLSRLLLIVGGLLFFLFLFTFPDGRFISRWQQRLALLLMPAYALGMLLASEAYGSFSAVVIPAVLILGLGVQVYRYRRLSSAAQRQQTKWVVLGATGPVVLVLSWVLLIEPGIYALPTDPLLFYAQQSVRAALGLLLPVALAISILRYRLWDIDLIINRTLVYGVMTGVVFLIYVLIVGGVGVLFQTQGSWLLALLATGLVAVLFQPLRDRLQRSVNRLLYGQRDEPFEVLAQLGQQLEQTIAPEAVYPAIVETVATTLRLPYVALQEQTKAGFTTVYAHGKPTSDPVTLPLTYQGEIVGRLLVGQRSPGEALSEMDDRLLRNIARQAGSAVYDAKLTADLQRSRQQLVTGREEERRRLRRDLHDGLGPSLASLLLEARVLRRLIANDPAAAEQLADEMQQDIHATIDDIRRVVHELRPPALDDLGLLPALDLMAARIGRVDNSGAAELRVTIEAADDLPALPAAVEVAAYRITQEALTNVVHHAQATRANVHLWIDGDLHIEVADDGVGFGGGREGGIGLHSMRERAAELGGTWSIAPQPGGGTVVRATLPLESI